MHQLESHLMHEGYKQPTRKQKAYKHNAHRFIQVDIPAAHKAHGQIGGQQKRCTKDWRNPFSVFMENDHEGKKEGG